MHIEQQLGDRIRIARVLAILGMLYVHIPPGIPQWQLVIPLQYLFAEGVRTEFHTYFGLLKNVIVEGPGRTSACLLSIVAGFLSTRTLLSQRYTYFVYIGRRFKALYLPMVFWSSLTLLLFSGMSIFVRPTFLNDGLASSDSPILYLANIVFFITDSPHGATIQLAFLRDLFVCTLISPLLILAVRFAPKSLICICSILYLTDVNTLLVLRPLVLLCFTIGIVLSVYNVSLIKQDKNKLAWGLSFLTVTIALVAVKQDALDVFDIPFSSNRVEILRDQILYPLSRFTGSVFLWILTARLVTSSWSNLIIRCEPYLFITYCSHVLVLGLFWAILGKPLIGGTAVTFYPVWFLFAPFLALACGITMLLVCQQLLPNLHRLIAGRALSSASTAATLKQ